MSPRPTPRYSSVRIAALMLAALVIHAEPPAPDRALPKLAVSANHRYLVQENGQMFFYLAQGFGSDWVLIVDDASKEFAAPKRPA